MKYVIMVMICGYLILSLSQPDYWIAKYNISHIEEIHFEDLFYEMYYLSWDAVPAIEELKEKEISGIEEYYYTGDDVWYYFKEILEGTEEMSVRNMTYSKLRARKAAEQYFEEFSNYKKP